MLTTSPTSPAPGPLDRFWALPWKFKVAVGVAVPIVAILALTTVLNGINYSVGSRTGVLAKLSRKGVACWTTEGQLALPNFARSGNVGSRSETVDNTFYFSVPDRNVQKLLETIPPGSPVTLEYRQKLFALHWPIPFFCVRRTEYEIVGAKPAPAFQPINPMPASP